MLPLASFATQLTTVVPIANLVPEAGMQVTAGFGSSLSVAVGSVKVTVVPVGSVVSVAMSAGMAPSVGATVSASVRPAGDRRGVAALDRQRHLRGARVERDGHVVVTGAALPDSIDRFEPPMMMPIRLPALKMCSWGMVGILKRYDWPTVTPVTSGSANQSESRFDESRMPRVTRKPVVALVVVSGLVTFE